LAAGLHGAGGMDEQKSLSDQLEERLIDLAATVIHFADGLPTTPAGRHIASQIVRCGTAPAPNYAEARAAESRADFIHKLGIVHKELNETSVWLRISAKVFREKREESLVILQETIELARIINASIRTAKARAAASAK
jgi:four helix bundle protein